MKDLVSTDSLPKGLQRPGLVQADFILVFHASGWGPSISLHSQAHQQEAESEAEHPGLQWVL